MFGDGRRGRMEQRREYSSICRAEPRLPRRLCEIPDRSNLERFVCFRLGFDCATCSAKEIAKRTSPREATTKFDSIRKGKRTRTNDKRRTRRETSPIPTRRRLLIANLLSPRQSRRSFAAKPIPSRKRNSSPRDPGAIPARSRRDRNLHRVTVNKYT